MPFYDAIFTPRLRAAPLCSRLDGAAAAGLTMHYFDYAALMIRLSFIAE